uniref:Uncharacterized protein n=2 Tax=Phlebotomus papatasi TaxID=29031 RepID=A0A1B0GPI2_PHLPP
MPEFVTLDMECWQDDLSPVQLAAYEKAEKEHNDIRQKITDVIKDSSGQNIFNGNIFSAYQLTGRNTLDILNHTSHPAKNQIRMLMPKIFSFLAQCRSLSSTTAGITKTHRSVYARTYPTIVVLPDGSSFSIRYTEPREIIKLPLDLNTLSEEEKKVRLDKRKPKKKIRVYEEVDDSFSSQKYLKMLKKK